jgi:hypothetical protein
MWMTPHHLVCQLADNVLGGERADFCGDLAVKDNLMQDVAEFLADFCRIPVLQRFQEFMAFLQEERPQGYVTLLPVPWTSVRSPELGHDIQQLSKSFTGLFMVHNTNLQPVC